MARREIIQIHIGQAGVQMANACWELYCLEHGIKPDGTLYDPNHAEDSYSSFFNLTAYGQAVPRVTMMDLEPTVIDEIRTGCYRKLFNPSLLLTGKEDAANNFARGKYGIGQEMLELSLDRIRRMVEECGNMQGFITFRAYGGGTGGGLGSLFIQELSQEFTKVSILEFVLFPSPVLSNIIVEPYNTVLATHASGEYQDLAFIMDNEAMYDILCEKLDISRPTFTNVNRIVGQIVSNVTASLRYEGAINVDLKEFQTNLVPYKRIHYPLITYAPFVPLTRLFHEQLSVASLTNSCFNNGSQLVKCELQAGKYMSCCLLYRGDVTPVDVNNAIVSLKNKKLYSLLIGVQRDTKWALITCLQLLYQVRIRLVNIYSKAIKNYFCPGGDLAKINRAVTMVANTTALKYSWQKLLSKYNLMLGKRAFVHHFVGEGMDESEFSDAKEDLKALICDYTEIDS